MRRISSQFSTMSSAPAASASEAFDPQLRPNARSSVSASEAVATESEAAMLDPKLLKQLEIAIDAYRRRPGESRQELVEHLAARLLMASNAPSQVYIPLTMSGEEVETLRSTFTMEEQPA